ncbi:MULTISPECIES: acyl-CoA thioesterase [unclassified Geodermatophilus]
MTATADGPTLLDVLTLEEIDRDLYRSTLVFTDPLPLYGGQVAAQALLAAGRTVAPERLPHSLHGYFLRSGDAARPTVFRVDRDRDGGSFSARRVVAVQGGEVVLSMSASFQAPTAGPDLQVAAAPAAEPPQDSVPFTLPRLFTMESRRPAQPHPGASSPTRFWARATVPLPGDPLLQACALTYLSDIGTGLAALPEDEAAPGPTLDHAVWFHRAARLDEWVLVDLVPHTVSGGRGWYTGSVTTGDGVLAASLAQETLFRPGRNPFRPGR